ncbi:MAG TPA: alanine racemase, partial [Fimbriimonadaceae bacterium]|nr:alanine racemase [Fimbriimonadaceae bacterium]
MSRFTRTWVDIDLPALRHNLGLVRKAIGPSVSLALVAKADAYGHGLVPTSGYALHHGADWVAVATVQEGVALREAGIDAPILVISPTLGIEAEDAIFYDLRVLVEDESMAADLATAAAKMGKRAILHLEVDTGLARFGCQVEDAAKLAERIRSLDVTLEGLSTHFANSSWDVVGTEEQIRRFDRALAGCTASGIDFDVVHVANSAGAVRYPNARRHMVRTGIACYGIDPYNLFAGDEHPVLSWNARVMVVRELPPNSPVSYAGTYRTRGTERIATLGVGYGDGYPRNLSNKGHVWLHGQPAPIVGLICMDQVLVDVSRIPQTSPGDVAELFGPNIRVPDVARLAETNPHELTC